jgi:hypothetical protein
MLNSTALRMGRRLVAAAATHGAAAAAERNERRVRGVTSRFYIRWSMLELARRLSEVLPVLALN